MGKLFIKSASIKSNKDIKPLLTNDDLYKPLSEFKWKDASQSEVHQNSIKYYKKKYAF